MIGVLSGLPPNVAGFKAIGEVTKDDYDKVVFPEIKRHTQASKKLNFVFFVDTSLKNFSTGAWIRDIWLVVKEFANWHKVAIISDVEKVRDFTNNFSYLLPGQYRGFPTTQMEEAVRWAATEEEKPPASGPSGYVEQLLPPQIKGESTETSAQVLAANEKDSAYIFERATEKLIDVNQWAEHCGALSATFQLTDETGEPLQGGATAGDFIRIDIPGPGTKEGQGYDWVRIERIEQHTTPLGSRIFLLQARPSPDPSKTGDAATAHFLEDSATSTFVIGLEGKRVNATVYGRNEVPNKDLPGALDRLRNAVVGSLGAIGISKLQWKALAEGLLDDE